MTASWNFDCRDGKFLDKLAIQSDYWTTKFVKELISDDKRTAANNRASSEHGIRLPENRNRIRSSKGQSQKLLQSKWWCGIKKLTTYSRGFHDKIKRIRRY